MLLTGVPGDQGLYKTWGDSHPCIRLFQSYRTVFESCIRLEKSYTRVEKSYIRLASHEIGKFSIFDRNLYVRSPRATMRMHGAAASEWRAKIPCQGVKSRPGAPLYVYVAPRPSNNRLSRTPARVHASRMGMTRRFYIGLDYCATFGASRLPRKNSSVAAAKGVCSNRQILRPISVRRSRSTP